MVRRVFGQISRGVGVLGIALLIGCGGGGGGGGSSNPPPSTDGGGTTGGGTTGGTAARAEFAVQLSGAVALMAQEDTVETVTAAKKAGIFPWQERQLFTYRKTSQGLSKANAGTAGAMRLSEASTTAGTNLLAVDAQGNASLAIQSNYPTKVMYSVTDPTGRYVYLALDPGWFGGTWDGNDYSQFIAQTNCAFYKAEIATNAVSCVQEGLFVQSMDYLSGGYSYAQVVSSNQKPIQFDAAGNAYVAGTSFQRTCNSSDWNNDGVVDDNSCWVGTTTWSPRIYRFAPDGTATALTQDNASVQFFLALSTGELAYQAMDQTNWTTKLYIWQNNQTIDLSSTGWGINFFTTDDSNTIIWGDWATAGLRFTRPGPSGGVGNATLDTQLFRTGSYGNTTPRRIIAGDDGRLYGVFENYRSECADSTCTNWTYFTVLSVYQILPYDPVPKVELSLAQNNTMGWWDWMSKTPFQVSKGYLYYSETKSVSIGGYSYGTADIIHAVKLSDRTSQTMLDAGLTDANAARYEMYSWRLAGDAIHFSALDKSRTVVVTGKIDTQKVRDGLTEAEYLAVVDTASAVGSTSRIKDIEVLVPETVADNGLNPAVDAFHTNSDNVYSASVDFSKPMDKTSVEANLALTNVDTATSVISMKVWLGQTLHLIPDSDGDFGNTTTNPLARGANHTLTIGAAATDAWDRSLGADALASWRTAPSSGWYRTTTDDNGTFSSGSIAKFMGLPLTTYTGYNSYETYDLNVPAEGNVRIEFSARNLGWDGMAVALWNQTRALAYPNDPYTNTEARVYLGSGYVDSRYVTYVSGSYPSSNYGYSYNMPGVFNGNWARYRVEFYGTTMKVSYANGDPAVAANWTTAMEVTDLRDRNTATNTDDYTLMLRFSQPLSLDNVQVTSLAADGTPGTVGGLLGLSFETHTGSNGTGFDTNVEPSINTNGYWW